jgi:hypothetical protein
MKTKLAFYPYEINSRGLVALQNAINSPTLGNVTAQRVRGDSPTFRVTENKQLINWGSSRMPSNWQWPTDGLNDPRTVNNAGNKLSTFRILEEAGISIPEYTTDSELAAGWIRQDHTVLIRHQLRGHSGEGIEIFRPENWAGLHFKLFPRQAPLYVKYKKKKNEYRVHVFKGTVLFVQEKRRASERERTADESLVRSHHNGWNFCRENIELGINGNIALYDLAIRAVSAIGLDFGAVDIIYNQREDQYYVLEINTAPGLQGESLTDYARAFTGLLNA